MNAAPPPPAGAGKPVLKRSITLLDATAIAIGAIIGAGIFVISGVAAGLAGPAVVLSIIIAGIVSSLTAYGYVRLSSRYAEEGGPYVYAKRVISRSAGFVTGWLWLLANIVAGATVSLGLGSYVAALVPGVPVFAIAMVSILLMVMLNIIGIEQSSIFNVALVALKLTVLALFVAIGLSHVHLSFYRPFAPNGASGVLGAAALIFFAYAGFGRPATTSEETRDPKHTVPRSIIIALVLSSLVYVLVGAIATGIVSYPELANSGSPLADAAEHGTGLHWLKVLVSLAAIVATASVLLTAIIGVSRVSFAMARDQLLPRFLSRTLPRFATPYLALATSGAIMAVLPLVVNLKQAANVANFGSLVVYAIVNFTCLVTVLREERGWRRMLGLIPTLGLVFCIALLHFLSLMSWIVGTCWIAAGALYYLLVLRPRRAGVGGPRP